MANPFKAKRLRVTVAGVTVGVVEGLSIELIKEGGVEFYYDSGTGKHAKGTRHATFSIRRWFKTDAALTHALLYDLFNDDIPFSLQGQLVGSTGALVTGSIVHLSDCEIYRFRLVTGTANDIVAEEASGEAVDWKAGTDISG